MRSVVVLPEPDGPSIEKNSPSQDLEVDLRDRDDVPEPLPDALEAHGRLPSPCVLAVRRDGWSGGGDSHSSGGSQWTAAWRVTDGRRSAGVGAHLAPARVARTLRARSSRCQAGTATW